MNGVKHSSEVGLGQLAYVVAYDKFEASEATCNYLVSFDF